jgi:small subunit ribosomal protein S15
VCLFEKEAVVGSSCPHFTSSFHNVFKPVSAMMIKPSFSSINGTLLSSLKRTRIGSISSHALSLSTASQTKPLTEPGNEQSSNQKTAAGSQKFAAIIKRTLEANEAHEARLKKIFLNPDIKLSDRQKQVYQTVDDEPPLHIIADHGFMYQIGADLVENKPEAIKRILSTRTAATKEVLKFKKQEILQKFQAKPFDTGSSRVQVAMMTERINRMSANLAKNKHDKNCKRDLHILTVRRKHLLQYMMRSDYQNYRLVIRELNLRPLPVFQSKFLTTHRTETHKQINDRNKRLKNRVSRGAKGH